MKAAIFQSQYQRLLTQHPVILSKPEILDAILASLEIKISPQLSEDKDILEDESLDLMILLFANSETGVIPMMEKTQLLNLYLASTINPQRTPEIFQTSLEKLQYSDLITVDNNFLIVTAKTIHPQNRDNQKLAKIEKRKLGNKINARNSRKRKAEEFIEIKSQLQFFKRQNQELKDECENQKTEIASLREELSKTQNSLSNTRTLNFFSFPHSENFPDLDAFDLDFLDFSVQSSLNSG